ncbi:MBL fold metallo-hydrolase [Chryseobacterium salviniae]|uniref:MBL fold metallo-hydrolase n=1 Tax=Chryseobacterium salviniae TaxID=3101750 RepID=A0ABU6HR35_9FLAO|nr:MBL fold metallo-hydrolase [Chryseobacterium sp. T9W2-O]MEC3875509.1 MBL fold metallo-hydrolase [Chryseobacterium sp. T9W2-O]
MKIHHLRNATFVIETEGKYILIDPMLGRKGSLSPFTLFRFKPLKNPLVDLPVNSNAILEKVTHCLITHLHPDHLDKEAEHFLKEKSVPVICSVKDKRQLEKRGLSILKTVDYWKDEDILDLKITGVPARHGYGFIANPMGIVMGFYLEFAQSQSVYISADTIYTEHIDKVFKELKPDLSVLACGGAQLDFGKPLLMNMQDIIQFIKNAPGKVLANHMEALNHCPITRAQLKDELVKYSLTEKVFIPEDGQSIIF